MSARDVYDARGFGGRQGAGERPAVVVVDFIEGFTNPESALACDADAAVEATRSLLDAARAASVPVLLHDRRLRRGRPGARRDVHREGAGARHAPARLALDRGRRAPRPPRRRSRCSSSSSRRRSSARTSTSCCATPAATRSIVAGASTSGCVRATAVDALQYGYRVLVPREAVADRAVDAHNGSLLDIDAKYGDVISIGEAIAAVDARGLSAGEPSVSGGNATVVTFDERARRLRRRVVGRDRRAPAPARRHPGARRLRPVRDPVGSRRAPRGVAPRGRRRAGRLRPHRRRAERELRAGGGRGGAGGLRRLRRHRRRLGARHGEALRALRDARGRAARLRQRRRSAAASRFPGRCCRSSPCRRPPARDPRSRRSRSSTSRGWGRRPASRTSTSGRRSRSSTPP